jgi:hypothetical protein
MRLEAATSTCFDMPQDSLVSSFFYILSTHVSILQLLGRVVEAYTTDFSVWKKEYVYVEGKLKRHMQKVLPNVAALNAARNQRPTVSTSRQGKTVRFSRQSRA